ncbi:sulfonate ABC transporter substrate-binding protein [Nitrospirillum sp. BR 11163]|uniref:sulfonate ABC transporter substrate-binding protein n=1 Tax=Nitrospirillum sp. BR 11163 TaxID=3104323 RepID=UPI002AFEC3AD|nr:sulfonate ABC transporter substrate-binding protein [Nitrospirillum sp. BR 11163]MEA1672940.1 sulfonate ABC transporter substrate-binding protein [Nitrospirillum sp. BR 11163]
MMGKTFSVLCRLALAAALSLGISAAHAAEKPVRIGYQKYGTLLLLKESGKLDEQLKAQGIAVEWREFPGGPQLLEALNVGALDFGTTGEAPPIFAQAAGAPLVYVGVEPAAPKGEAILVPKDSPLKSVADLKGKKVALNKGSNVHYLLVKALEDAGLKYSDIQPTYLAPADARAAFEQGSVDAWVIWDPYYAAAAAATQARVLVDGVRPDGSNLVSNHQFYLAERGFNEARPQVVQAILAALRDVDAASRGDQKGVAQRLSPQVGIPAPVLETALARMGYGVQPITPDVVAAQQKIADTFHQLGLIPKPITVSDAIPGSKS